MVGNDPVFESRDISYIGRHSAPQCVVYHLLECLVLKPRLLSQSFGYVVVYSQRGSHGDIIVYTNFDVKMLTL